MSDADARVSATVPFIENQSVTPERLGAISGMAHRNTWDGLAALLLGGYADDPLKTPSGFVGASSFLPLKGSGDLDIDITAGFGIFDRVAAASVDPLDDKYAANLVPLILRADLTIGTSAHDPTDARIDRVSVKSIVDFTSHRDLQDREVFNTSTLVWDEVETDGYTEAHPHFVVTLGTPGSGLAPSTPAGCIPVANVYVPATSGPCRVEDIRTMIRLGNDLATPQAPTYAQNIVLDGCVMSSAGTDMFVDIASGEIIGQWAVGGEGSSRRYVMGQRVEIPAAEASEIRLDAVVLTGAVPLVIAGTPDAANPRPPYINPNFVLLGYVIVPPAATTIDPGNVANYKAIRPYRGANQSVITIDPRVTLEPDGSGFRVLTVEVADWDLVAYETSDVWFEIEITKPDFTAPDTSADAHFNAPTTGTVRYGTATVGGTSKVIVSPSASLGKFVMAITDVAAPSGDTYILTIRPIVRVGARTASEYGVTDPLVRYRAGQPVVIDFTFAS